MKQTFITLAIYVATALTAVAVARPDVATMQQPSVDMYDELCSGNDVIMPSLAEMLGEDVDDFGEFDVNAALKSDLVGYAKQYLGTRYRRGGKGPNGFDCSGFTSYVFRNFGYVLSPASRMQGVQGEDVDIADVEVGDLMFFSGRAGGNTVGHVGMVVDVDRENGTCRFIHASSSQGVVIQQFPDGGYYSRRYLHSRRVLAEDVAEPLASTF